MPLLRLNHRSNKLAVAGRMDICEDYLRNLLRVCGRQGQNSWHADLALPVERLKRKQEPGQSNEQDKRRQNADDSRSRDGVQCSLTFDMSGGARGAKRPLARPLDGGVRRHRCDFAPSAQGRGWPGRWAYCGVHEISDCTSDLAPKAECS